MDSLWKINDREDFKTPLEIIKDQAKHLEKETNGYISGELIEINQDPIDKIMGLTYDFAYNFIIKAKYIKNYELKLFKVEFDVLMYPVNISFNSEINNELKTADKGTTCVSADEFISTLASVLSCKYVADTLGILLKISKSKENELLF